MCQYKIKVKRELEQLELALTQSLHGLLTRGEKVLGFLNVVNMNIFCLWTRRLDVFGMTTSVGIDVPNASQSPAAQQSACIDPLELNF